jgi:hypothetical protein
MDQLRILVLSTYPPARCGIATFSRDLVSAMVVCLQHEDGLYGGGSEHPLLEFL